MHSSAPGVSQVLLTESSQLPSGGYYDHSHFTDEEAEGQRNYATCPRLPNSQLE